jgi:hypothetical protein
MQAYKVIKPLSLGVGTLVGLSQAQAEPRKHALEPTGTRGVYQAKGPLSFKAGEVVGLDDPNLKRLSAVLEPVEAPAKPARAGQGTAAAA